MKTLSGPIQSLYFNLVAINISAQMSNYAFVDKNEQTSLRFMIFHEKRKIRSKWELVVEVYFAQYVTKLCHGVQSFCEMMFYLI